MKPLDWTILAVTLLCVMLYGLYKSRTTKDLDGYFLSNRSMPWYLIVLSIMGTQASAVTFLAAPGQAYTDGMRFVQYYFGLPIAAIIICISFVPVFSKLKIYTAYEFLENRFDIKTRTFASSLFLLQRGLSTGISIFAPSIILSVLFGWNIYLTHIFMGGFLIIYTVAGGAKAVAYTQQLQFLIIMAALLLAGYYIVQKLPQGIGFKEALTVGGRLGKLNVITSGYTNGQFDWGDRYNIFSGIIGGFFLALSYFGTDQSQVGRYLTAKNVKESRLGLLANGILKVPMQFFILLLGVLVFAFYQFHSAPAFFNEYELNKLHTSPYKKQTDILQQQLKNINTTKTQWIQDYANSRSEQSLLAIQHLQKNADSIRTDIKKLVKQNGGQDNDTNYIFLRFAMDYLPTGLIGLIIAVIFMASWGSIAAALHSLASSSMIDFHKRFTRKEQTEKQYYRWSKIYTLLWGLFCIAVAMLISNWGNSLIEVVNILGSLFYGTILGIFLVAFYAPKVRGNAVFIAAVIAEGLVIILFFLNEYQLIRFGFLWLNAVGAIAVYLFSLILQAAASKQAKR